MLITARSSLTCLICITKCPNINKRQLITDRIYKIIPKCLPKCFPQLLDEVEHDIMNYQNRGLC